MSGVSTQQEVLNVELEFLKKAFEDFVMDYEKTPAEGSYFSPAAWASWIDIEGFHAEQVKAFAELKRTLWLKQNIAGYLEAFKRVEEIHVSVTGGKGATFDACYAVYSAKLLPFLESKVAKEKEGFVDAVSDRHSGPVRKIKIEEMLEVDDADMVLAPRFLPPSEQLDRQEAVKLTMSKALLPKRFLFPQCLPVSLPKFIMPVPCFFSVLPRPLALMDSPPVAALAREAVAFSQLVITPEPKVQVVLMPKSWLMEQKKTAEYQKELRQRVNDCASSPAMANARKPEITQAYDQELLDGYRQKIQAIKEAQASEMGLGF